MDIGIRYVPTEVNEWIVTRAVAKILHSDDFAPNTGERPINFRVKLNASNAGGVRNNGSGILTTPTVAIGNKFLKYVQNEPIKLEKRKLKFFRQGDPPPWLSKTLDKTRYVDPDIEELRQNKLLELEEKLRVDLVQFGTFFRQKYPANERQPVSPRSFSIEWERDYINSSAWMTFDYDDKVIRMTLGSESTESEGFCLAVSFAGIQKVGVGYDGKPYLCFDTLTPPVMERFEFHRPTTGDRKVDNRKYKQRVGSLNEAHAQVAPYALQMRVVLYHDSNADMIEKFISMCRTAGFATDSLVIPCNGFSQIEALKMAFFNPKRLYILHKNLAKFPWAVSFQLEALLHNGILNTDDMDVLIPHVRDLLKSKKREFVGDLLRRFNEGLRNRTPLQTARESPLKCYQRVLNRFTYKPSQDFQCCHVTFTPTRLILDGPFASQSNRVIRHYQGYEDHFIRVDFRDEDRLQYRWDREVDGSSFLRQRVGGTLKEGFTLAGRAFEFLAYSTSALREHSVWFMNPFEHPREGQVTSASIRRSLGSFEGTELLKMPSKYAARLAQAFTATDMSVDITRAEWKEIPDLGEEPYLFTDGVGTISGTLRDRIWEKLTENKFRGGDTLKPSAFQIRFLGYKGVVAVDEQLDKDPGGIHMCLRPSMRKFDSSDIDKARAPIEIAQAFKYPNTAYLNRPLVTVLEDVGARKESFQDLQDKAEADARTIDDSVEKFCEVLGSHGLGIAYGLRRIMTRLQSVHGLDLKPSGKTIGMDYPFLKQVRQVAMNDILRDIKHSARIPVPDSYLLVGVADEGPAYQAQGFKDVFCLKQGEIYACIQRPTDTEPTWIHGNVSISRSPVVHPGDVQRVFAIGKPPGDVLCLFSNLRNVVVLPSIGDRSLASCLGGGDVDGDMFAVICHDPLLPTSFEDAAEYKSLGTWTLDRDSTIEDICDFVVKYIESDLLGLLSDRWLVIADQSVYGVRDEDCLWLAERCSHAVDFPKQGIPLDLDDDILPRTLIRCKPDWHAAEVVSPRKTDYYESDRALGHLFRSITLEDPDDVSDGIRPCENPLADPISAALLEHILPYLGASTTFAADDYPSELLAAYKRYTDELRYVCATHTLSNTPGVRLLEAEVVVGTILAKCSQKRFRKDRMYRMRLHSSSLVGEVQRSFIQNIEPNTPIPDLITGLENAWRAWHLSLSWRDQTGASSFGLIALGTIFDCLDKLPAVI